MAFKQDYYTPINKDKCINLTRYNEEPYYRSGWEKKVFYWADTNVNVIRWGAELKETVLQYQLPSRGGGVTTHNYHPDLYAEMKDRDGKTVIYLIEVKPLKDATKPKIPKRKTQKAMATYEYEMNTYIKNKAKWKYAQEWCRRRGIIFKIFTEDTIFNKKRKKRK